MDKKKTEKMKAEVSALDKLERALNEDPEVGRAWGTDPASVLAKFELVDDPTKVEVKFNRFERKRVDLNTGRFGNMLASAWCGCGHICSLVLEGDVEFETS